MPADFATKWFIIYYPVLGLIFMIIGVGFVMKPNAIFKYLQAEAKSNQPPALPRNILKYFFLFTFTCLALSLFSFSWLELLFSIWSLIIIYAAGIQLVRWSKTRQTIQNHPKKIKQVIKYTGAIMLAVSPVMFLLCYLVIQRV